MTGGFSATHLRRIPVLIISQSSGVTIGNGSLEQRRIAAYAVVLPQAAKGRCAAKPALCVWWLKGRFWPIAGIGERQVRGGLP
jgi:hypothetical protein